MTPSPPEFPVHNCSLAFFESTVNFENIVGIVIPTIFGLVILIGLIGNILVILVVVLNRQMQNSTNTLIINLAFADLLFLILCVPFTAADYALPVWVFSREWCKIMQYLQSVSAYASVWTLVMMSFDRFLAVVYPLESITIRTVKNTLILVSISWILILGFNVPNILIYDIYDYWFVMEWRSVCAFIGHATFNGSQVAIYTKYLSFNAFGYVIPLSVTCVLYVILLRRLWFGRATSIQKSEESQRTKKKVTCMVSGIIVTFALCWLPLNICFFAVAVGYTQHVRSPWSKNFLVFQVTSQVLAYTNSCMNPILYAFLSDNFRKAFIQLLNRTKFCCRENSITGRCSSRIVFDHTNVDCNSNRRPSHDQVDLCLDHEPSAATNLLQVPHDRHKPPSEQHDEYSSMEVSKCLDC